MTKIYGGLLSSVKLKCKMRDYGCTEVLDWGQFEGHTCGTCPKCGEFGIIKYRIQAHLFEKCPVQGVQCPFCRAVMK